jgi:hypothetical protein
VEFRASSPLAENVLLLYMLDSRLHGYEFHPTLRITDVTALSVPSHSPSVPQEAQ